LVGCVLTFGMLGFIMMRAYRAAGRRDPNAIGIASYALLFLIAFNINRIDLQTTFKMSLLFGGSAATAITAMRRWPATPVSKSALRT
jgi:hypothetical protein